MYKWKVVPFCKEQKLDIDYSDILYGGHFRKCDVYKSGGGYDRFPDICYKRIGKKFKTQFVVQLHGCHLQCPYCYVTPNGVWGDFVPYTSDELIEKFLGSVGLGCRVFHLMGGSPALYIEAWSEIIDRLGTGFVFHSDLTLTEKRYDRHVLKDISRDNCLYAVNVKGVSPEDYYMNTGRAFDSSMFWLNFYDLVYCDVPFYVTFTNPSKKNDEYMSFRRHIEQTFGKEYLEDSFVIDLVDYDATKAYYKGQ